MINWFFLLGRSQLAMRYLAHTHAQTHTVLAYTHTIKSCLLFFKTNVRIAFQEEVSC